MNTRFLRACRREPVDATPVWFMRQAGRYMAEYRALRQKHSLLELCRIPELAAAVTLQPVERIEVDAAILFSDLLLPLAPMGLSFDFVEGEGPQFENPVRTVDDIDNLRSFDPSAELGYVLEAIKLVRRELDGQVPLIGFAGAPFTLASYAIEGGPSRTYARTRALMSGDTGAWHRLCDRLATLVLAYLKAQVRAGVDAVQLFDSWVGTLTADEYRTYVKPHSHRILSELEADDVLTIHFGTRTAHLLEDLCEAGGSVIGVDWRVPLDEAWSRVGPDRGVQGNLDPSTLLGDPQPMLAGAADVLRRAAGRPGHIFNLGHGILPSTPVENVQRLARFVHQYSHS